jgi:hypothetical protein
VHLVGFIKIILSSEFGSVDAVYSQSPNANTLMSTHTSSLHTLPSFYE